MGQLISTRASCQDSPQPKVDQEKDDKKKQEELIFDEMDQLSQSQQQYPQRPPAFDVLMNQVKLINFLEPLDGLRVELGLALSPHLQLSNIWALHPGHPGIYSLNTIYAGGNVMSRQAAPNPLMMGRYEPFSGRQDIRFMYRLNEALELKINANYMSRQLSQSQLTMEMDYSGSNYVSNCKISPSLDFITFSYMQSLNNQFALGYELVQAFVPKLNTSLNLGGKYRMDNVQLFFQWLGGFNSFNLGATIVGNKHVTFATEVAMNPMTQESEMSLGCAVRFPRAKYHALVNSRGVVTSYLIHALNPFIKLSLCGEIDYRKGEHRFGIGFSMGT